MIKRILQYVGMFTSEDPVNSGRSHVIWIIEVTTLCFFVPAFEMLIKKQSNSATRHGGAWGERRYSSYSFLTSVLDGGEWSASRPGRALPRGKDPRYPLHSRLGGPQSWSGPRG
jgi:hypothetical protein